MLGGGGRKVTGLKSQSQSALLCSCQDVQYKLEPGKLTYPIIAERPNVPPEPASPPTRTPRHVTLTSSHMVKDMRASHQPGVIRNLASCEESFHQQDHHVAAPQPSRQTLYLLWITLLDLQTASKIGNVTPGICSQLFHLTTLFAFSKINWISCPEMCFLFYINLHVTLP